MPEWMQKGGVSLSVGGEIQLICLAPVAVFSCRPCNVTRFLHARPGVYAWQPCGATLTVSVSEWLTPQLTYDV